VVTGFALQNAQTKTWTILPEAIQPESTNGKMV
jgi:hypothetical protein